jgi:hypothetical protein
MCFRNHFYTTIVATVVVFNPATIIGVVAGFAVFRSFALLAYCVGLVSLLTGFVLRLVRAGVTALPEGRSLEIRGVLRRWTVERSDIEMVEYRNSFLLDLALPWSTIGGTYGIVRRSPDGRARFTRIPVTIGPEADEKFNRRVEVFFGDLGIPVSTVDPRRRRRVERGMGSGTADPTVDMGNDSSP